MPVLTHTETDAMLATHRDLSRALGAAPRDVAGLTDAALLDYVRIEAGIRQRADANLAAAAGEIARRSDPALGKDGLARSAGFRTAEALVQELTGSTAATARREVEVGRVLGETDSSDGPNWLGPVRDAVLDGSITTDHAAAITRQLGTPSEEVPAEALAVAAVGLVEAAGTMNADRVRELTRDVRNDLDCDRVADREALLRSKRSVRFYRQDDGTSKLVWIMDPETSAVIKAIIDRATSPKLGGPRFVDSERADAAERIVKDPRTTEQLASDLLRDLLEAGAALDAHSREHLLLQVEQPAVKILVTAETITTGRGAGYLEGSGAEVSTATIDRARCAGTTQTLTFSPSGQALDVGRRERLFTGRQREILAAKWGGCAIPWCDRPPTWCEYHHIHSWADGGGTDTGNGILLCRSHHQDLHNNGWSIQTTAGELRLHTPDRAEPIPLEPKSRAWKKLSA